MHGRKWIRFILTAVLSLALCLSAYAEGNSAGRGSGRGFFTYDGIVGQTGDDYVPKRIGASSSGNCSGKVETSGNGVEYEAWYDDGSLEQLEIDLEKDDGTEYEVLYDAGGKILRAEYEADGGEMVFDGSVWKDASGKTAEGPDLSFMQEYFSAYPSGGEVYPHNTMCVLGLPLREVNPDLTDRWYHVLPVDLSKEGVFRYRMAVSNLYILGYCEITVRDGKVTVDYAIPNASVYPERQCMAWFTSLGEITSAFLESPSSDDRFGKPVDIREDLKGQEIALLFICNQVSYRVPPGYDARVAPSSDAMRAYQKPLRELLQRTESSEP